MDLDKNTRQVKIERKNLISLKSKKGLVNKSRVPVLRDQECNLSMLCPFLSVTNFTKLERLHRAASHAITGCPSSYPIPLLFSKAFLPPLRVTLTHFTLSSYERALCLPTFPILGLPRHGLKPRLCRSSWRAFASTHPLMLSSTSPREDLLACPPFPL